MRLAVARDEGLDEQVIAAADRREPDLAPRHRAALALADAEMTMPADLPADLVEELHRLFAPAELVELTLDVMKWNYQKIPVALGVDDEVRPGELTDLVFDSDGNWMRPTAT